MSVPAYTLDELNERISDGSVDQNRLSATVAHLQHRLDQQEKSVTAAVDWINSQIQSSAAGAGTQEPEAKNRKR